MTVNHPATQVFTKPARERGSGVAEYHRVPAVTLERDVRAQGPYTPITLTRAELDDLLGEAKLA
jgi:hypothetical protein